ncbi:hypothetical protein [Moorena producens]|nr:hypothetical protein [Moorena producens]
MSTFPCECSFDQEEVLEAGFFPEVLNRESGIGNRESGIGNRE